MQSFLLKGRGLQMSLRRSWDNRILLSYGLHFIHKWYILDYRPNLSKKFCGREYKIQQNCKIKSKDDGYSAVLF